MAMRPIQTQYKGYFFRSRLEARWAVFFDYLGIKWEYELEGFHLSNGEMYLPDFFLPNFCGEKGMYVEVKPERIIDPKAQQLAVDSGVPVLMACGVPGPMTYTVLDTEYECEQTACFDAKYLPGGSCEDEYRLFWNPGYENEDGSIDEDDLDHSVLAAIVRARSSRFEYGQRVGAEA
jgi:hypothetical protein